MLFISFSNNPTHYHRFHFLPLEGSTVQSTIQRHARVFTHCILKVIKYGKQTEFETRTYRTFMSGLIRDSDTNIRSADIGDIRPLTDHFVMKRAINHWLPPKHPSNDLIVALMLDYNRSRTGRKGRHHHQNH